MRVSAGSTYYGLSDIIEVLAWVQDDSGADIHKQVKEMTFSLLHENNTMFSWTVESQHYSQAQDESEGSFRAFLLHPPIQRHQYVSVTAELLDGDIATARVPVLTDKMLQKTGQLTNPAFGGQPSKVYTLPVETDNM